MKAIKVFLTFCGLGVLGFVIAGVVVGYLFVLPFYFVTHNYGICGPIIWFGIAVLTGASWNAYKVLTRE